MKRKIKIKLPLIIMILCIIPALVITTITTKSNKEKQQELIFPEEASPDSYPVINENDTIIYPYVEENVKIGKSYYDYKGEEQSQENSLILHDNTYYQSEGIDFVSEKEFEVLAIYDGTVTNIKEDDNVGKTVEIKHENGLISIYQSLKEVNVKKNDIVSKGQVIGMSGTNEMEKDLGNHLHLEIYENGQANNPENYLGKTYEKKN